MFDLATAKARLGIADSSKDTLISGALAASISLAERFCDRKLAYAADSASFYHFQGDIMFLPRYPVEAVIATAGMPEEFKVHHQLGAIEFAGPVSIEEATITYSGGYQTYPPDLELALWGIFDNVYPALSGQTAAAVESVTIPDVGTIRYAAGNNGAGAVDANVLGAYHAILETYRRVTC